MPLGTLGAGLVAFSFLSSQALRNSDAQSDFVPFFVIWSVAFLSWDELSHRSVEWGEDGMKGALMRCWVFEAGHVTPW